ncbi:MAG TPA: hypothetical protein VJI73_04830 [Candidatus Paceibacterota bacterium]
MLDVIKKERFYLLSLIIVAGVLSLITPVENYWYGGKTWQSIPPTGESYYLERIREIADGHPLLGNPYFIEHTDEIAPAFFVPDWIATIPYLLGAPMLATMAINNFIWGGVFVILLYFLFRKIILSPLICCVGVVFAYIQVYSLMIRPVSMQLIFPVFIFFLIALYAWLSDQGGEKTGLILAISIALSVYDYSYLAQLIFITYWLIFAYYLYRKDWTILKNQLKVGVLALFFALPGLILTFFQTGHPFYLETMRRIGLVYTHLPTAEVYYHGRWIILAIILGAITILALSDKQRKELRSGILTFVASGLGVIILSASNWVTGLDLEIAQHVQRFAILLLAVVTVILFYLIGSNYYEITKSSKIRTATILSLLVLLSWGNISYGKDFIQTISSDNSEKIRERQQYANALSFLEKRETEPVVILAQANSQFNSYIPMLTKHYVLFADDGALHLVSSGEVEERYLVAKYFESPNEEDIGRDMQLYAGSAINRHEVNTHNRAVRICRILRLDLVGRDCGILVTSHELNRSYVDSLYERYKNEIEPNIKQELVKFGVSYIIKDNLYESGFKPERLPGIKNVYFDARFSVYKFSPL